MDKVNSDNASESVFNQSRANDSKKSTLWASFTHTSINGYDYIEKGENAELPYDGYDVRRSGIIGGIRRILGDTLSGGFLFSITTPDLTQRGMFSGVNGSSYYTELENTDFQFALHVEKVFADYWETAFYIGGGCASDEWNRSINDNIDGQLHQFGAETTGNNLTATAYLARRIDLNDNWTLRPTIGLDSEHSWMYGFDENCLSGGGPDLDPQMFYLTQKLHYDTVRYSRNTARIGLTGSWAGDDGRGGLTGRIFYGVQLGGDGSASVNYKTIEEGYSTFEWTRASHEMGGESVNLGLGGYYFLNKKKTLSATADINGIWYQNATTQNVTGGINWRF